MGTEDRRGFTLKQIKDAVTLAYDISRWPIVEDYLLSLEQEAADGLDVPAAILLAHADSLLSADGRGFTLDELMLKAQILSVAPHATKRALASFLARRGYTETQIRRDGKRPLVWVRR